MGGYRALLIGNSSFPADTHNLQRLAGPVNDVAVLRAALADPSVGLFDSENVRLVPERTSQEILMELERFFTSARRDDTLLLYYSGHGVLNERNQLFLCARDTRTDLLQSTAVGAASINLMFEESAAGRTVIVLDCCHSGAFKGGNLADSLRGSGRYLLTSCRSSELASDATRDNTTSIFTSHLVDGLLRGAGDSDGDGFADISDVYDYVYARLVADGKQIPQRSFSGGGDVAIARRTDSALAEPPGTGRIGTQAPRLALSTVSIDLGEVGSGDELPPEDVLVLNEGGGELDWVASTADEWIHIEHHDGLFRLFLHPRPGLNRGRVIVQDREGGVTKVVGVTARLVEAPPAPASPAEPAAPEAATVTVPPPVAPQPAPGPPPPGHVPDGGSSPARRPSLRWPAVAALGVAAVVGLVALIAALGSGDSDGGDGTTAPTSAPGGATRIALRGSQPWVPVIAVTAGQQVHIESSGTIIHDVAQRREAGPDGDTSPDVQRYNVVADFPHGGLIARVGESGQPFAVGSMKTFTSPGTGTLYVQVNDVGLESNGGEFRVTVRLA